MSKSKQQGTFRFSFGPWNIHPGADPFGPAVRKSITFAKKLALYKQMGFDGVQNFPTVGGCCGFWAFPGGPICCNTRTISAVRGRRCPVSPFRGWPRRMGCWKRWITTRNRRCGTTVRCWSYREDGPCELCFSKGCHWRG